MAAEPTTVQTSLTALRTPSAAASAGEVVTMGFNSNQGFELMQRGAKLLAASTLVPTTYQNNIPNCVIALNMASRLGADPLLVMQNLYVVHGRPAWSAQFLIATFNQCGRFAAIRYKWSGTEGKDDWSCQAYALEKDTQETITGPVISIALAKKEGWYEKSGSKWKTIPQLMLMYRAAAWLVRTHAPELSMGLQTAEEVHDVFDAQRGDNGQFVVDVGDLPRGAPAAQQPTVIDAEKPEPIAEARAVELFRDASTVDEVNTIWQNVVASYAGTEIPVGIEAARNTRRDVLKEKAAGK